MWVFSLIIHSLNQESVSTALFVFQPNLSIRHLLSPITFKIHISWLPWVSVIWGRLSLVAESGGYSPVVQCGSSSRGLSSWSRHVESSQMKDWTHVLCFGRQILNHWTTREVLLSTLDCLLSFGLAFQKGCELLHYRRVILCASLAFPNRWSREWGKGGKNSI